MPRLIYLKIAKVAGTSLVEFLKKQSKTPTTLWYEPKHVPNSQDLLPDVVLLANRATIEIFRIRFQHVWNNTAKLVVLRDPVERAVSSYNYIAPQTTFKDFLLHPPSGPPGVDEFSYNHSFVQYTLPQLEAVTLTVGEVFDTNQNFVLVDFANLNKSISRVTKAIFGSDALELPHKNKGNCAKTELDKELTPELIKTIEDHFAADVVAYQKLKKQKKINFCFFGMPTQQRIDSIGWENRILIISNEPKDLQRPNVLQINTSKISQTSPDLFLDLHLIDEIDCFEAIDISLFSLKKDFQLACNQLK